jgi:hypothetical protein
MKLNHLATLPVMAVQEQNLSIDFFREGGKSRRKKTGGGELALTKA